MSKSNPRKAVSAILPPGVARINPMTLGVYAALERIKSPLVTGVEAKDTLEIIPSLYLLTHDPREVFRGNVVELAMAWAAEQPITAVEEILAAAKRQMDALFDVIPEGTQKKTAATTAGSPRQSTGRRGPTAGAGMRSSGTSPRPRSSSSSARSGATSAAASPASR